MSDKSSSQTVNMSDLTNILDLDEARGDFVWAGRTDVDADGNVYIAPSRDHYLIKVHRPDGSVLREFGLPVHDVLVVPNIPKTTSGKVARHRCEEIYREARSASSSPEGEEGGT